MWVRRWVRWMLDGWWIQVISLQTGMVKSQKSTVTPINTTNWRLNMIIEMFPSSNDDGPLFPSLRYRVLHVYRSSYVKWLKMLSVRIVGIPSTRLVNPLTTLRLQKVILSKIRTLQRMLLLFCRVWLSPSTGEQNESATIVISVTSNKSSLPLISHNSTADVDDRKITCENCGKLIAYLLLWEHMEVCL